MSFSRWRLGKASEKMLDAIVIEEFFKSHAHTLAALEAVSTFLAVVISLGLSISAQRANRTRIRAQAGIIVVLHSSLQGMPAPTYVTVDITNVGILPVSIPLSFFLWKVPLNRGAWVVHPLDFTMTDEWVQQKQYPVEIKPRSSKTFTLQTADMFRDTWRKNFAEASFLQRCQFRFLMAEVITDEGRAFKVKMSRSLRSQLRALILLPKP